MHITPESGNLANRTGDLSMSSQEIYRRAANGEGQIYSVCSNVETPRAAVQFIHDMSEHSGRYDDLAKALNDAGYDYYANDIIGHGMSKQGHKGGFSMHDDSLDYLLDDIDSLFSEADARSKDAPKVLAGIGFGALLAELYCAKYGGTDMLILISPLTNPKAMPAVSATASNHIRLFGRNKKSPTMQSLIMQTNKLPGSDPGNQFYWLSSIQEVCTEYALDEDCGFPLTSAAYKEVIKAFKRATSKNGVARINDIPVYIVAGKDDQLGECGDAAIDAAAEFGITGHNQVALKLYKDCCHDIIHDTCQDEFIADITQWIDANI